VKVRITIANRLALGFGILLLAVITTSYYTYRTLNANMQINAVITKIYSPSVSLLNEMLVMLNDTKILIKHWASVPKDDTPDKLKLREVQNVDYPELLKRLAPLVSKWDKEHQSSYRYICKSVDSLFNEHRTIMEQLNNFAVYDDLQVMFVISPKVDDQNGEIIVMTDRILDRLGDLVGKQETVVDEYSARMDASFIQFKKIVFWTAVILSFSVIVIAIITTRTFVRPVRYLKDIILKMGKGILPSEKIKSTADELGEMADALNLLVKGLKETSEFSLKIGVGDYTSEFHPLSDSDTLGNSLIIMRENLRKAEDEAEMRRKENFQRTWASQGLAKFSVLLRQNNDNMEEFSYLIISNLVQYLGACIGGIYIINDEDKEDVFIDLAACYAYDRRKYLERRIEIGINVVGQCVLEKETIYMTEIPKGYVKITSGLGEDDPIALLVVPLITNDEVMGVVEIASFEEFEQYQIEFVEKTGENIAATILSVKVNNNTTRLLRESQDKSERLARQEEEMRQNIEEMKATQEELIKKDEERSVQIKREYDDKFKALQTKIDELQKKQSEKPSLKFSSEYN